MEAVLDRIIAELLCTDTNRIRAVSITGKQEFILYVQKLATPLRCMWPLSIAIE